MLTDQEIVSATLSGRTTDFRLLVTRYERRVYKLCARIIGNREDALDAAQDAFIRAYSNLAGYDSSLPLWPWLRRISVNCCLRIIRLRNSRGEVEIPQDWPSEDCFTDALLRGGESERVLPAVSELPEAYRTVVVLRYQEEMSAGEIAELLGETPGAVRVRLHRALKMLANRLAVVTDDMRR